MQTWNVEVIYGEEPFKQPYVRLYIQGYMKYVHTVMSQVMMMSCNYNCENC